MRQPLTDTTPKPAFLRGLQNQAWTVSGAISELVDNGFGAGRGDASLVHLTWYSKDRVLTVLDNGQGMDDVARLFQLGNTIGRHIGDIGEYGSGGTMALIWLGRRVNVWTLRGGKVAIAHVDWDYQIRKNAYPGIDSRWHRATAVNTPAALLALGHGTCIALRFPPKRAVHPSAITSDLASTYAPAIRQGRKLIWQTAARWDQPRLDMESSEGRSEPQALGEPMEIPDSVTLAIKLEVDGQSLTAHGQAGHIEGLPISQSSIAIGFGPRLLLRTKECYHSDEETFSGVGVTGYLDLDDGWQPFLATTKSKIDDHRVWSSLMAELFTQLRPLLVASDREAQSVFFEDLALELQKMFDGSIKVSLLPPGVEPGTEPGGGEGGGTRQPRTADGPDSRDPDDPVGDQDVLKLYLQPRTDSEMDRMICRVEVQGDRLTGSINREHDYVKKALLERPPNRPAFTGMVANATGNAIIDEKPELLKKIFDKATRLQLENTKDVQVRRGLLVRLLLDRVRAA